MMGDCQIWRTTLLHAVANEKLIQELFKFNFIRLLTLIGELYIATPDRNSLIYCGVVRSQSSAQKAKINN
jgi:hypothetical protein